MLVSFKYLLIWSWQAIRIVLLQHTSIIMHENHTNTCKITRMVYCWMLGFCCIWKNPSFEGYFFFFCLKCSYLRVKLIAKVFLRRPFSSINKKLHFSSIRTQPLCQFYMDLLLVIQILSVPMDRVSFVLRFFVILLRKYI